MTQDPKQLARQAGALWAKLGKTQRALLIGAAVATLGVGLYLSGAQPAEHFTTLFGSMSPEDAGEVLEQLKTLKIPYRMGANGASVEVPEARVQELRVQLAASGLPRGGGVGFEVFDKQTFGASSFVEQMNYRRAVQGELQRTISALAAVERARVHLAIAERSVFRDREEPASASVALRLRPGRHLSREQVRGIVHLVSSSVEGLTPAHVTVVDESGAVLSIGDDSSGDEGPRDLERGLARRVTELVERVVGPGRASVSVAAEVDTQRVERTEEVFDKDRIAVRSESRVIDGSGADVSAAGVAGARANLPGAPAPTTSAAAGGTSHLQESRNYEVNRTVTKTTSGPSRLRRLHVAVLIDERALKGAPASTMEQIAALARTAVGVDADRGDRVEVRSIPFLAVPTDATAEEAAAGAPKWRPTRKVLIGGGAGVGVLLLVIAVLVVRALKGRRRPTAELVLAPPQFPVPVRELEVAIAASERAPDAPVLQLATRPARERAIETVRRDAARAAQLLAAWLDQEPKEETHT